MTSKEPSEYLGEACMHCAVVSNPIRLPLVQWFSKCGLWNSDINIPWEFVRNATDQAPLQLTELETLGIGPINLF